MTKEIFGVASVLIGLLGMISYTRTVYSGKTHPHIFTWVTWSISTFIVFLAQFLNGAGPGSWSIGLDAIFTIFITLLSIKHGVKNTSSLDKIYFLLAICSIFIWILFKNPLWSVIILTLVDLFAYLPTIIKIFKFPASENMNLYISSLVRHILSMFAMLSYSLIAILSPIFLILMNTTILCVFIVSKKLR